MTPSLPTRTEIEGWILTTVRHSASVEHYIKVLSIDSPDPERPHDIVGPGNKLEWGIMKVLAIVNRDPRPDFETIVLPALELHRIQYHHRRWNEPDPGDSCRHKQESSEIDMNVGAIDAICSLFENREYQSGSHDFDQIAEVSKKNPPHKVPWMLELLEEIRKIPVPDVERIMSLEGFPNIGIPPGMHSSMRDIVAETADFLFGKGGIYS